MTLSNNSHHLERGLIISSMFRPLEDVDALQEVMGDGQPITSNPSTTKGFARGILSRYVQSFYFVAVSDTLGLKKEKQGTKQGFPPDI